MQNIYIIYLCLLVLESCTTTNNSIHTKKPLTQSNEQNKSFELQGLGHAKLQRQRPEINVPGAPEGEPNSRDQKQILSVIKKNKEQIRECYDELLSRKPGQYGKMKVEWHINAMKKVIWTKVLSSDIEDEEMKKCVCDKIEAWTFPGLDSDYMRVTFPFAFQLD